MPGMMDTILNLGLKTRPCSAGKYSNNERSRGLLPAVRADYATGHGRQKRAAKSRAFEVVIEKLNTTGITTTSRTRNSGRRFEELVNRFKALIKERTGPNSARSVEATLGRSVRVWSWMMTAIGTAQVHPPNGHGGHVQRWSTAIPRQFWSASLHAHPATGEKCSTANSSSTPKAKTSWPACARRTGGQLANEMPALQESTDSRDVGEAFQGRAGFRVHHRDGKSSCSKPQRQTHRIAAVRFAVEMEKEKSSTGRRIMRVPAEQLDQVLARSST